MDKHIFQYSFILHGLFTMNSNVEDRNNKRKIIRGGSWKDVAYFLEVSTRDFEYGDTARSYIGFRTVQSSMGSNKLTKN